MFVRKHRRATMGIALLVVVVMGMTATLWLRTHQAVAQGAFAVYLEPLDAPASAQARIPNDLLRQQDVSVTQTVAAMQAFVAASHPQSIWINEVSLGSVPQDWLRQQMRQGVVIVGINATERELKDALGVGLEPGGTPDWRFPGKPTFVIYYEVTNVPFKNADGSVGSFTSKGGYNDYYDPARPERLFSWVRQAISSTRLTNPGAAPSAPGTP